MGAVRGVRPAAGRIGARRGDRVVATARGETVVAGLGFAQRLDVTDTASPIPRRSRSPSSVFAARAAVHNQRPAHAQGRLLLVVGAAAFAVAVVVTMARSARGRWRAPAFALGAGVCFGVASAFVRSVVGGTGACALAGLGVASAVALGLWCVQRAYAHGRPETVVARQSVAVGACLLGEFPHADGATACGALAGAALTATGVVLLARGGAGRTRLAS